MSNHDRWLESQGGCYQQLPSCETCGYELCGHGQCRYCAGCATCEQEEHIASAAKKPPVRSTTPARQRNTG